MPEPVVAPPRDVRPVGRFAPSPTGPLHFGSLVTALAGFLQARQAGGEWLVRIDDIDPPREQPGAAATILHTLEVCGLHWDRSVVYQRRQLDAFRAARRTLVDLGAAYHCRCSRQASGAGVYAGTCRTRHVTAAETRRVRLRVPTAPIGYTDLCAGRVDTDLSTAGGDFVIWRVEDLPAFHLAAVVDDALLGVNEIVRGADLQDSAPRQRALQVQLGLPETRYLHLPLAVDAAGQKLSKQNLAPAIDLRAPGALLTDALTWLDHPPPRELRTAPVSALLAWAIPAWSPARLAPTSTRPAPPSSADADPGD